MIQPDHSFESDWKTWKVPCETVLMIITVKRMNVIEFGEDISSSRLTWFVKIRRWALSAKPSVSSQRRRWSLSGAYDDLLYPVVNAQLTGAFHSEIELWSSHTKARRRRRKLPAAPAPPPWPCAALISNIIIQCIRFDSSIIVAFTGAFRVN